MTREVDIKRESQKNRGHLETISEHVCHLRICFFRCFLVLMLHIIFSYVVKDKIFQLLFYPLQQLGSHKIYFFAPQEAFFVHMKMIITVGLLFACPWIIFLSWRFFSPVIFDRYRSLIAWGVFLGTFLFLLGMIFSYCFILSKVLNFFLSFHNQFLKPILSAKKYFDFISGFLLAFGFMFTMPVEIFFMYVLGLVSFSFLKAQRAWIFVIILFCAALLTPPDIFSQIFLALPVYFLYECTLLWIFLFNKIKTTP